MSLIGDWQEAKALWKNADWITRAIIVLSVFLASSAITSMSEVIAGWKGFIADGIVIYRAWLTTPIAGFVNEAVGWRIERPGQDALVIAVIVLGGFGRALAVGLRSKALLVFFVLGGLGYLVLYAWVVSDRGSFEGTHAELVGLYLGLLACAVLPAVGVMRGKPRAEKLAFWSVPLVSVALVLVLGAINVGLS